MKKIKTFENFTSEDAPAADGYFDRDKKHQKVKGYFTTEYFNELSHKDKIKYLVDKFGMEKVEAMEICPNADITVEDLPNEIREYFGINKIESLENDINHLQNEGKLYQATRKEHSRHDWDLDKSKEIREKVEVFLKSVKCKTKKIGSDLEVYFDDEYIAQVMFRKDFVTVKKDGAKFGKEFKYTEFGKIKEELKSLI